MKKLLTHPRKEELENHIRLYLNDSGLTEEEILDLLATIKYGSYDKDEIVFKIHHVCTLMGVLLSGKMITEYPNTQGKQNNTGMMYGKGFPLVCQKTSFDTQLESDYSTKAMEDSEIAYFTFDDTVKLYKDKPGLERVVRLLMNFKMAKDNKYHDDQKVLTNAERYEDLIKNDKPLYNAFDKKYIDGHFATNKNTKSRSAKKKEKPSSSPSQTNLEF
jgi:hypothetical protein